MSRVVLIVDDEADIRLTLADVLEAKGFETATAANGRDALDYLRNHEPPCIILLDLNMRVMGGVEFLEKTKSDPNLSDIPVVICSAHAHLKHWAVFNKVRAFVKKPADPRELTELVAHSCLPQEPMPPVP